MAKPTKLPEARLASLYEAPGFGGETTQRAKVIRELIDEIRRLRVEVDEPGPGSGVSRTERPFTA
jgi:hypothetical protein